LGNDIASNVLSGEPDLRQNLFARCVLDEFVRQSQLIYGGIHSGFPQSLADARSDSTNTNTIFDGDDEAVVPRHLHQAGGHGNDPPRIYDGGTNSLVCESLSDIEAEPRE
jgi:hypothetical protein